MSMGGLVNTSKSVGLILALNNDSVVARPILISG